MHDDLVLAKKALVLSKALLERYPVTFSFEKKVSQLRHDQAVIEAFYSYPIMEEYLKNAKDEEYAVFASIALLGQLDHVFSGLMSQSDPKLVLARMSVSLIDCERFYAPMGGLLGYYKETVERIIDTLSNRKGSIEAGVSYREVPWYDFRQESKESREYCEVGLRALETSAELFTVGGAGERLGLMEKKDDPLPVAYLLFLGRPLLEHLFRDLEAREYLYEKTFGTSITVPVVLMTSKELHNDRKIDRLLQQKAYFHRPVESIHKVIQFLVPLIDLEGNFILSGPCQMILKPGGHGVLWRLLCLEHTFDWLHEQKKQHLLIRQINNPLAGIDNALLQLVGVGKKENKRFGFASMVRAEGLTEGLNVLRVKENEASITNVEYTAFGALLEKDPDFFKRATFAANANILYANLEIVQKIAKRIVAPAFLINMKSKHLVYERGRYIEKIGVRLESTMQNIADELRDRIEENNPIVKEELSTFLNLHERAKLFSVTKRPLVSSSDPKETPEYCLYDWYRMTRLLIEGCQASHLPKEQSFKDFFEDGPNFLFLFHPALGPLWSSIQSKLRHIIFKEKSILEVELAEANIDSLILEGALSIRSMTPCGVKGKVLSAPRLFLKNVTIKNEGIVPRRSVSEIVTGGIEGEGGSSVIMEEGSELIAENVELEGPFSLTVPRYTRCTLKMDPVTKSILYHKEPLPLQVE